MGLVMQGFVDLPGGGGESGHVTGHVYHPKLSPGSACKQSSTPQGNPAESRTVRRGYQPGIRLLRMKLPIHQQTSLMDQISEEPET
jgi:hypothetical protein